MSNLLHVGNFGPGIPLFACDQEWYFSYVGPGIRADFAAWCRIYVQKQLKAMKAEYSPQEFKNQERMLQDKILGGHYSWGTLLESVESDDGEEGMRNSPMGEGLEELLNSAPGQTAFVKILLKAKHGEVGYPQIREIMKDNPEGAQFAIMEALWRYPNLPTPEQAETIALAGESQRRDLMGKLDESYATTLAKAGGKDCREMWQIYHQWRGSLSHPAKTTSPTPISSPS